MSPNNLCMRVLLQILGRDRILLGPCIRVVVVASHTIGIVLRSVCTSPTTTTMAIAVNVNSYRRTLSDGASTSVDATRILKKTKTREGSLESSVNTTTFPKIKATHNTSTSPITLLFNTYRSYNTYTPTQDTVTQQHIQYLAATLNPPLEKTCPQ